MADIRLKFARPLTDVESMALHQDAKELGEQLEPGVHEFDFLVHVYGSIRKEPDCEEAPSADVPLHLVLTALIDSLKRDGDYDRDIDDVLDTAIRYAADLNRRDELLADTTLERGFLRRRKNLAHAPKQIVPGAVIRSRTFVAIGGTPVMVEADEEKELPKPLTPAEVEVKIASTVLLMEEAMVQASPLDRLSHGPDVLLALASYKQTISNS